MVISGPVLGVIYHWAGGLAAASFYIPYRVVRKWSWETYWLVGGFFSWIIAPFVLASLLVPHLFEIFWNSRLENLVWAYAFGVLWGIGGLTFGLTMRYLGVALGMAVALGFCAAFGTLMPPIFTGEIEKILSESSGRAILVGIAVCLLGIAISGIAGVFKERELTDEEKKAAVKEFDLVKGLLVAVFSGVMSASFAYGLAAGKPIAKLAATQLAQNGRADLWQNLPVLVIVLLGGFTTNFIWCAILNIRNKSGREYVSSRSSVIITQESVAASTSREEDSPTRIPLFKNYIFSALAGVIWYMQFFFYSMGQTKMGRYEFSSWTLHMASIIIFATLWGLAFREWAGTSRRTHWLIALGTLALIFSTIIVGYGNFLRATLSY